MRRTAERSVRADLRDRARAAVDSLPQRWARASTTARYGADGGLAVPAQPATARRFSYPHGSAVAVLLAAGKLDRAREHASTSSERAAVFLRARDNRQALEEPALKGTELYYLALLEEAGNEPSDDAVARRAHDEIAALLDGPSDRLGRTLLARLGVTAAGQPTRADRTRLARWGSRRGVFVADDVVGRMEPASGKPGWVLKTIPLPELELGTGPFSVALSVPYSAVAVRGDVDPRQLSRALAAERRRAVLVYGLAALILVAATVFALVAVERARRLAQAKDDFVANVTHELKTPLANIQLYAESLHEDRVRAEDRDDFVRTILDEASRLDTLVEGLLHAARGPQSIAVRIHTSDVLQEAERRWRPRLEGEGFRFVVRVPELPSVHGDREALVRALGNLLDNARKYDRKNRCVELVGGAENGHVRLTVRDAGPGIPVEARARVMRPFTRLESADRKETGGVGLGLSLVRSCMKAHGGCVEIAGQGGAGAVVSLVLPVAGSEET